MSQPYGDTSVHDIGCTQLVEPNIEDLRVVPLERNLCGHPLAGLLWEKTVSKKFYLKLDEKKYRIGNVFLIIENNDSSDKHEWKESKHGSHAEAITEKSCSWWTNIISCSCEWNYSWRNFQRCLNHIFLLEQLKNCCCGRSLTQKNSSMVVRHGRTCSKMRSTILASWQTRMWSSFSKFSSPCLDDHQFKQEELESVGDLSQVRSQIVWKYLFVHGTTWKTRHSVDGQQTCESDHKIDSGMRQTIGNDWFRTFITHECRQYCHVGNTAQHCRLGFIFKTQTLLATFKTQHLLLWRV